MFDLKDFVNCDGQIYCWHPLTNSIVKIEMKGISVKDCPEEVVEALLRSACGETAKRSKDKGE